MPRTFNGIGTKFYGKRDIDPDGSYITTEFHCVLDIPLIPICSYRVHPIDEKKSNWFLFFGSTSQNYVAQKVELNKHQIRNIYLAMLFVLFLLASVVGVLKFIA